MRSLQPASITLATLLGLGLVAAIALGQAEYPTPQGGNQRQGRHDANTQANNPGRSFLRWWDPLISLRREIDNDTPGTVAVPIARWLAPTGESASNWERIPLNDFGRAIYRYAFTTLSRSVEQPNVPQNPANLSTYSWLFNGTQDGQEYALFVNIPIGPTDVDPSDAGRRMVFQQAQQVYEIRGVRNPDSPGQPVVVVVDGFVGGLARLGGDRLFVADNSGTIEIRLINTTPRDGQGDPINGEGERLVYADTAVALRGLGAQGSYVAQPIVGRLKQSPGLYPWRVFSARNEETALTVRGQVRTYDFGIVNSYVEDGTLINGAQEDGTGRRNIVWSWPARRPFADSEAERLRYALEKRDWANGNPSTSAPPSRVDQTLDFDNSAASVVVAGSWTVTPATSGANRGVDYLTAPAGSVATAIYEPILRPETDYEIFVWVPSNVGGLSDQQVVEIYVGGQPGVDPPSFVSTLNLRDAPRPGWLRVRSDFPNSRLLFRNRENARLRVRINAQASRGGTVYADAVRFQCQADLSITSTPVFATVNIRPPGSGTAQLRDVVIVASNNGRVYCLDARGNVDSSGAPTGTTTVYWAYPSELPEAIQDPNHAATLDGPEGGIAEMPLGFDTSSALVQRVNGRDLLYIGTTNGRVYCIDMEGRGDGLVDGTGRTVRYGTTERVWSYPSDWPSTPRASLLGPFSGSLAFQQTAAGPTVFAPTAQGRLYALDAVGQAASRTTTVRWSFPDLASPTLGSITMTPAVFDGRVYFGASNASFYALDQNTGAVVWSRPSFDNQAFGRSSPAVVSAAEIGGASPVDTVFVANGSRVLALNAQTGAIVWNTNEISGAIDGGLTFTWMSVFNRSGTRAVSPVVVAPTINGAFIALFARPEDTNRDPSGTRRRAWQYDLEGQARAGVSVGGGLTSEGFLWMYGVDSIGYLYAFNNNTTRFIDSQPPGQEQIVENDTSFDRLREIAANAKITLLAPLDYEVISRSLSSGGGLSYNDILSSRDQVTRTHFEFGETMYVMVYDLPNPADFPPGDPLRSLQATMQFSSPGTPAVRRTAPIQAVLRDAPPELDGVALLAFPILGVGNNASAPGSGNLEVGLAISGQQSGSQRVNNLPFQIANPLALETLFNRNVRQTIGLSTDAQDPENVNNGNIIGGTGAELLVKGSFGPEITSPGDPVTHGQSAFSQVNVYDRSLQVILTGQAVGNVRFAAGDLAWQGSAANVYKPLPASLFPNFEDLPNQVPNISLDYPDLRRDSFRVTKDRFGRAENPLLFGVTLEQPRIDASAAETYRTRTGYNAQMVRTLVPTRFEFETSVPLYQPPNRQLEAPESPNKLRGYSGFQSVYIDNNQPGRQFAGGLAQEAFRSLNLQADVGVDERLSIGAPTVDLGSLAGASGFTPGAPSDPSSPFNPWVAAFRQFFKPVRVFNDGNVNLLNVRVAKATEISRGIGTEVNSVAIPGIGLHERAWLDAPLYLFSDIDPRFAPVRDAGVGRAILQKARPRDPGPTTLSPNPIRRDNANLGVVRAPLLDPNQFPPGDPRVGVAAPIGTPVGPYQQQIFFIEDRTRDAVPTLGPDDPFRDGLPNRRDPNVFEPYSDPGVILRFNVRETRLTTSFTPKTAPMFDQPNFPQDHRFFWSSLQPAAIRDGSGNLYVAFASNRLDAANNPAWLPKVRQEEDAALADTYRIYMGVVRGGTPGANVPGVEQSPMRDLNRFQPDNPQQWFRRLIGRFPVFPDPQILFGANLDERIEPGSVSYGSPVFPTGGVFDPLAPITQDGRPARNEAFMVFLGEAVKRSTRGERTNESRLFISRVRFAPDGSVNVGSPQTLRFDPNARVGRPTLVQNGQSATVFYTRTAGGNARLSWNTYELGRRGWGDTRSLEVSASFESVGSPSATLRRNLGANAARFPGVIDLVFSAKLRGRAQTEAYLTRLAADAQGRPAGRQPRQNFPLSVYPLTLDAPANLYWGPGADWAIGDADLNAGNAATRIDVVRRDRRDGTGRFVSIIDPNTQLFDRGSRILSYETVFGGRVYIDTGSGSVRFSGAVLPRNVPLAVQCAPGFLRVSSATGSNYRGVGLAYDERFIAEFSYWVNASGTAVSETDLVRNDRFVLTYGRTSGDGSAPARPYFRTLRFGIQLPTAILTDQRGFVANVRVTPQGSAPAAFYQIDPVTGRIYFMAESEDHVYRIEYTGVDEAGAPINQTITVSAPVTLVPETPETAVPIEQVANEAGLAIALDPMNLPFNSRDVRRPGLLWMVWSSTRAGNPDVYMQTIAPRFTPRAPGR